MATELKAKMGENEKEIPAWIQDHISKAENYISQASSNYHEYGQNEARIAEDKGPCWKGYKQVGMKDKGGKQVPNCVPNESIIKEAGVPMYNAYLALSNKVRNLEDVQKELSKKYFAEKELNKKTTLLQQLKKGTDELKKWRARMAKVESDYIMNLDRDSEYSG
jgi:hypothetical protein